MYLLLCALSALLLLLAWKNNHLDAANAAIGVACSIVTVIVVDLLWGIAGGAPLETEIKATTERLVLASELLATAQEVGLKRVYGGGRGPSEADLERHRTVTRNVDLCARALRYWTEDASSSRAFLAQVRTNIKRGVQYRLLVYRPYFQPAERERTPFALSSRPAQLGVQNTIEGLAGLLAIRSKLAADDQGKFAVKVCTDFAFSVKISRFDDVMTVAPYVNDAVVQTSPQFVISNIVGAGGLFGFYLEEFEMLFNDSPAPDDELLEAIGGRVADLAKLLN